MDALATRNQTDSDPRNLSIGGVSVISDIGGAQGERKGEPAPQTGTVRVRALLPLSLPVAVMAQSFKLTAEPGVPPPKAPVQVRQDRGILIIILRPRRGPQLQTRHRRIRHLAPAHSDVARRRVQRSADRPRIRRAARSRRHPRQRLKNRCPPAKRCNSDAVSFHRPCGSSAAYHTEYDFALGVLLTSEPKTRKPKTHSATASSPPSPPTSRPSPSSTSAPPLASSSTKTSPGAAPTAPFLA